MSINGFPGDRHGGGHDAGTQRALEYLDQNLRVVRTESMRQDGGLTSLAPLARAAPPDRSVFPRLPVPEGWVELKVRGAHQTLMMDRSVLHRQSVAQLRVTLIGPGAHVPAMGVQEGSGGDRATVPVPVMAPEIPPGADSLALAVERWSAGDWHGVHSAWLDEGPGGMVLYRLWEVPLAGGGRVDIGSQYTPAQARHLDHRVDAMVAALHDGSDGPHPAAPEVSEALYQDRLARRRLPTGLPGAFALTAAGIDWIHQLAEARRGRLAVTLPEPPADIRAAGLAEPDGTPSRSARRMHGVMREPRTMMDLHRSGPGGSGGTHPAARFWVGEEASVVLSRPGPESAGVHLGLYPNRDLAELVLRLAGHTPEGPFAPPAGTLTWDQMMGRASGPASTGLPDAWGEASKTVWQLVTVDPGGRAGAGQQLPGVGTREAVLQVLTVPGFGHYRFHPEEQTGPVGFRLREVSGLALLQELRSAFRAAEDRSPT